MTGEAHRLDVAAAFIHALIDVAEAGGDAGSEAARRRDEAYALIAEAVLPTAVFACGTPEPRVTNPAWQALFPSRHWPELAPRIARMCGERSGVEHIAQLELESTGHPAFCAVTLRPIRDAAGKTTGVIVVCMVTTDEVLARELDAPDAALIWSAPIAGEVDYCNARWHAYTGNGGWQAAIDPEDLPRCSAALAEASRERLSSDVEVRIGRHDGASRWHRVRFSTGRPGVRWFGVAVDIHETRDVEARLDELVARERAARADAELANRLKDQFLATVSHELRAPLTTMLLWERILADGKGDPATRARALEAIHESALAQSHLVGDLLDISRAITGKLFVDLRPVDLGAIIDAAIAAAADAARNKGVTLTRADTASFGDVLGDPARLRQVIDNLLSNAIKFTDKGSVTITPTRKPRVVAIDITDTGRGIAPEFLSRMFEPFSQTEDMLTRRSGGLGLGLTIAKQLVELHHGTLTAKSPGLGCGATFTLVLPRAARAVSTPPRGIPRPPALDGIEVLVVDDDRRVRDALALLLRRAGASVAGVDSAEAGRVRIGTHAPDVIICDIAMPGEDGYQFVEKLRRDGSAIPTIALSAHATDTDSRRAKAAGFDLHLAKPIDIEHLVSAIDALIAARRPATIT